MGRRHLRLSLFLSALLVVPVALAWACTPLAHIQLDRSSYQPGSTVTASGTNFLAGEPVTFSINGSQSLVTVQASSTGYVVATFALPASVKTGDAVLAQARDSRNGDVFSASAGLVVEEPAQAPAPAGADPQPGPAVPTPAGASQPAGAPTPASRQPARARGQATSSTALRDARAQAPVANRATARENARPAAALAQPDPATFAVPATAPRRAGSAGRTATARTAQPASQPSVNAVTSDLWSGLIAANRPSLAAPAGAGPSTGADYGLAGTILLVLGLGTLAVGVAVTNARRRAAVNDRRR